MDINKLKDISIFQMIVSWGYEPVRLNNREAWFYALNRKERTPSLKVDLVKNRFNDFGSGNNGSIIDFIIYAKGGDVSSALNLLSNTQIESPKPPESFSKFSIKTNSVEVVKIGAIKKEKLIQYILSRGIPFNIANHFCSQIDFNLNGRKYYAIGFKNDDGGFEMRNAFFKSSTSPKSITFISGSKNRLMVFEGFFDFLSLLAIEPKFVHYSDFLILNSLSFLSKIETEVFLRYDSVDLFFDNDEAGKNATIKTLRRASNCIDRSLFYDPFNDLNEWLVAQKGISNLSLVINLPLKTN